MIPALAFGDLNATVFTDVRTIAASDTTSYLGMREIRETNKATGFEFTNTYLEINKVIVGAWSSNGVFFERFIDPACELILPLEGEGIVESGGSRNFFHPKEKAFVHTYQQKKQATTGSGLTINLNCEQLNKTCATLLGFEEKKIISSNPQTPSLRVGDLSFLDLFRSLCFQIDAADANPKILQKLALDDSFYRLSVGLLFPEIFLTDETRNGKHPYTRPELAKLCEFLSAHLMEPISLTQMEQMSGLSARVLQRSFQKAFGLRPKQWLTRQRLHAARSAMLKRDEQTTITSLAYDFCFASPSKFARHYLEEFGELPSQTLARK